MFRVAIQRAVGRLSLGLDVTAWQRFMERLLARFHTAAYMAGQDSPLISETDRGYIFEYVQRQFQFLDNFVVTIQSTGEFQRGWYNRAALYANSIIAPYWKGVTKVLPLPAMPGDLSTPCGQNCACGWEVVTLDEQAGDYDCYWRLNAFREIPPEHHCQVCPERAEQWAPLRIRGGRVQIPAAALREAMAALKGLAHEH